MSSIIEASQLPDEEKVYLKKDFLGWRVVEPIKNEDGSINWFNLLCGGKKGLFLLIGITLICFLLYFGINQLIAAYKEVAANPCNFCTDCFAQTRNVLATMKTNLSQIKLTDLKTP